MSNQITITLPDSSTISVEKGKTVYDAIGVISKGLQSRGMRRGRRKVADLSALLEKDVKLKVLTFDTPQGRDVYWHSASHLMAQAIRRVFPGAKFAIGPSIDTGFYYDVDIRKPGSRRPRKDRGRDAKDLRGGPRDHPRRDIESRCDQEIQG